MSLDTVLIISFAGILIGLLLYLFSSDEKIINFYSKIFTSLKFDELPKTTLQEFKLSIFAIVIDCIVFLMILGLVYSILKEEIKFYQIIVLAIIFLIPVFKWKQSIGQKLLHIKVLKINGLKSRNPFFFLMRYILQILFLPLNIIFYLRYKILIHNLIFKTYEEQE